MKVAIVGSRVLYVCNLQKYIPDTTTELVSCGKKGVKIDAHDFAEKNNLKLTEILCDYRLYGKSAPLKRNIAIIDYSDEIVAFWDGLSSGTKFIIDRCNRLNKKITVYMPSAANKDILIVR